MSPLKKRLLVLFIVLFAVLLVHLWKDAWPQDMKIRVLLDEENNKLRAHKLEELCIYYMQSEAEELLHHTCFFFSQKPPSFIEDRLELGSGKYKVIVEQRYSNENIRTEHLIDFVESSTFVFHINE